MPPKFRGLFSEEFERRRAEEAAFNALPLIEKNAIKIAALEREWCGIDGMREVSFVVSLIEREQADSFAADAAKLGFSVEVQDRNGGDYPFCVRASRSMTPDAKKITDLEEWFLERTEKVAGFVPPHEPDNAWAGARFAGWSYPSSVSPEFLVRSSYLITKNQNAIGARDRTRVLFGDTTCKFEASNGWATKNGASKAGNEFKIVPSQFLENARRKAPVNPEPSVSMFSQWIYSLYSQAKGSLEDQAIGMAAESDILAARRAAYCSLDRNLMKAQFSEWRLKHIGMNLQPSDRVNYFVVDELNVAGQPLRALPDLIYRNDTTGDIILVEVKHSQMDIPTNLWPNIWGQLWCYSQITELREAPKLTVIGEVWGDKFYGDSQYVYLRASIRRNPRAIAYDRFFRSLFDIYRGVS